MCVSNGDLYLSPSITALRLHIHHEWQIDMYLLWLIAIPFPMYIKCDCVCVCYVHIYHFHYKKFLLLALQPHYRSLHYSISKLCILTITDIIHILITSFPNCCNSFLIGILCFYLWFIGHTAAIFILLTVILLSEYFPTQILHCFLFPNSFIKHSRFL